MEVGTIRALGIYSISMLSKSAALAVRARGRFFSQAIAENMSQSLPAVPPLTTLTLSAQAGFRLKQIRERFGLTLRQVEEGSLEIADAERSSEYVVSTARLNQIENDGSLPSIYKFYSLAVITG